MATIIAKNFAGRENEIGEGMAQIYANEFTEQELKDLVTFYKTPLGQKLLTSEPQRHPDQHVLDEPVGAGVGGKRQRGLPRRNEEARQADLIAQNTTKGEAAMAEFDVDLFVIGGGSGGVRAARIAADHGAKVMVAEEYRMGGTCVIRGCVPKKLFVLGSHVHQEIEDAAGFGWTIPQATFDWPTLIANKDKEIARLEAAYTANVEKSGAQIVKARAVFEDPHTLRLADGKKVTAKYVLIATGGRPNHGAAIPGIEHVISSDEAFHLPELAQARGGAGRRLYRAGVRLHLRRLRQRRDAGLSRRKHSARLR